MIIKIYYEWEKKYKKQLQNEANKQRIDAMNTWTRSDFCADEWGNNYTVHSTGILNIFPSISKTLSSTALFHFALYLSIETHVKPSVTIEFVYLKGGKSTVRSIAL